MAKDPQQRYPSAGDLAAAARNALNLAPRTPTDDTTATNDRPPGDSTIDLSAPMVETERAPETVTSPPVSASLRSNPAAGRTTRLATPPPTPQRTRAPAEETDLPESPSTPQRSWRASVIIIGLAVALVAGSVVLLMVPRGETPSVIPDTTLMVTATIPVGDGPGAVAVSPDGRRAYITNLNADTVSVIDTG